MNENLRLLTVYRSSIGSLCFSSALLISNFIFPFVIGLYLKNYLLIILFFLLGGFGWVIYGFIYWTSQIKIDDEALEYSFFSYKKFVRRVQWTDITKVTPHEGILRGVDIYYKEMKPYAPLFIGKPFSRKTIREILKMIKLKSTQIEFDGK